jgi:hypothetical protein
LFAVTSHRVLLVRPIADPEDLSVRSAGWRAAPFTRGDEYDMNRKLLLSIPTIVLLASTVSFAQEEPPPLPPPPSDSLVTEKPLPPDDALRLQPLAGSATTAAMGTAFTYQGQLRKSGAPVTGSCNFQFSLFDAASGGAQIGATQTKSGVSVSNGLFTIPDLDFGSGAFNGEARWLEIAVQCPGDSGYTALSPRQALTPAPYALALPGLWTQQNATSPNLIGGHHSNEVTAGAVGATIGGGGKSDFPNRVTDDLGTVSGGLGNQAGNDNSSSLDHPYATVGGGRQNTASGGWSTVGGGDQNTASGTDATVGGGWLNTASGNRATIGGGTLNTASGLTATVSGGERNTAGSVAATVGGGYSNTVVGPYATIGGGYSNTVSSFGTYATIGGGYSNSASGYGTVGGGTNNSSGFNSTVSGGDRNTASGQYAAIGGGFLNTAAYAASIGGGYSNAAGGMYATVGGGIGNSASGLTATIAGGWQNTASASAATVGGGFLNAASGDYATIGGGDRNTASGNRATVGGGYLNTASGLTATIGGGADNTASGAYATIPGGFRAQATRYGQLAYASGMFANPGDAQSSLYVLRNTTNSATPTPLYLDGASAQITVPAGRTLTFEILVTARNNAADSAGYLCIGVVEGGASGAALLAPTACSVLHEDLAGWDVTVATSGSNLVIQALGGGSGNPVRWVAVVRTAEVAW